MHEEANIRRTSLTARGEPKQWLFGGALVVALSLIAGLLVIVVLEGAATFWPRPLELAAMRDGTRVLGVPMATEWYSPTAEQRVAIEGLRARGELGGFAEDSAGRPLRRLYRVANRELGQDPFRWVPLHEVESLERPREALFVERRSWGPWIGIPEAMLEVDRVRIGEGEGLPRAEEVVGGERVRYEADGAGGERAYVRTREVARGAEATIAALRAGLPALAARRAEIERINKVEIGRVNAAQEWWRLRVRDAEMRQAESGATAGRLGWGSWSGVVAAAAAGAVGYVRLGRRSGRRIGRRLAGWACGLVMVLGLMGAVLERPWGARAITAEEVAAVREEARAAQAGLQAEFDALRAQVARLEAEDARVRVVVRDVTTGRFAPVRQSEPGEPMAASQVVRAVQANALGVWGRLGVYGSRWWEFVAGEPREVNTEGGVFPVIVGTVLMTLLLAVAVVPLGVVAALYLREYAKQGAVTSAVRIAINNLAGVPSIVYGVFGLGFFCYTVGGYIDSGPEHAASRGAWWSVAVVTGLVGLAGMALVAVSRPAPGTPAGSGHRWSRRLAGLAWLGAAVGVGALLVSTPYFRGLYRANLPNPTFGGRGLLWASLTLALMTLPVVIVATEEAIAAVPRSAREGSYGCGASKWQTIRRIVLPGAMPGVLTGTILAMTRGAGEVAPLMLVGVLKSVSQLPVDLQPPFLHLDRSFMHLGFHIFDLGFQSPDSDAARPMVWTTTLLLVVVVVVLNVAAITMRGRLRARLRAGAF